MDTDKEISSGMLITSVLFSVSLRSLWLIIRHALLSAQNRQRFSRGHAEA